MSSNSARRTSPRQDGFPQFGLKIPCRFTPSWPSSDEDMESTFSSLARQNLAARGKPISFFSATPKTPAIASSSSAPKKEQAASDVRTRTNEALDDLIEKSGSVATYANASLETQKDEAFRREDDYEDQVMKVKIMEITIEGLRGWIHEMELDGNGGQETIRGWEEEIRMNVAMLPSEKEFMELLRQEAELSKADVENKKKFLKQTGDTLLVILKATKDEETYCYELLELVEMFWRLVGGFYPDLRIVP